MYECTPPIQIGSRRVPLGLGHQKAVPLPGEEHKGNLYAALLIDASCQGAC